VCRPIVWLVREGVLEGSWVEELWKGVGLHRVDGWRLPLSFWGRCPQDSPNNFRAATSEALK
jgi:hypothetical protein